MNKSNEHKNQRDPEEKRNHWFIKVLGDTVDDGKQVFEIKCETGREIRLRDAYSAAMILDQGEPDINTEGVWQASLSYCDHKEPGNWDWISVMDRLRTLSECLSEPPDSPKELADELADIGQWIAKESAEQKIVEQDNELERFSNWFHRISTCLEDSEIAECLRINDQESRNSEQIVFVNPKTQKYWDTWKIASRYEE